MSDQGISAKYIDSEFTQAVQPLLLRWRTFEGVRHVNRQNKWLSEHPDDRSVLFIADCCRRFTETLDLDEIEFIRGRTPDLQLVTFYKHFVPDFRKRAEQYIRETFPGSTIEIFWTPFFNLALEILVEAFRYHPNSKVVFPLSVQRYHYLVYLPLRKQELEEEREQHERQKESIRRRYWEKRDETPSNARDWDNENLAPARKARLLHSAVKWLNDVGFLTDEPQIVTDFIKITQWLKKDATNFFTLNRARTVDELIMIVEACAGVRYGTIQKKEGEYDPQYHARRGCELWFLFRHINKVTEQLSMPSPPAPFVALTNSKI